MNKTRQTGAGSSPRKKGIVEIESIRSVLKKKAHAICSVAPDATVYDALGLMGWSASSTIEMAERYGRIRDNSLRQARELLEQ
jgi:hypothetical protein